MALRHLTIAAVLVAPSAAVAGPRDDLLRLVPDDYTFCVVLQNFRELGRSEGNPSLLKGVADSPLMKGLQTTPEARKFQQAFASILKDLGVTPDQLRDDLLGDALVFAYRKGPAGQEGKEDGLILLHARDANLLQRVVDRVVEIQTKAGEIKGVEAIGEGTGRYFRRMKTTEGGPADYYAVQGHRLVFSGSETLLKSILPRLTAEGTGDPPIARRMKRLGISDAPASVLINPRSFDADVAGGAQAGKGSEQAFLKEFATYWKAVDGLAFFVNVRPSLECGLALNVRRADLPAPAARFFAEAGKRSPLWDRIPDDALLAVAGRVHLESLAATLGGFLLEEDRKKVLAAFAKASRAFGETEEYAALARGLGPDVGFWVTAPERGSKVWAPHAVLAVRVADGPDGRNAERTAVRGLDFLARMASLQHDELRIHTENQGPVEVHSVSHPTAFPAGFRPAFAAKGGYVVLADSPDTIRRFQPPAGPATDADEVPILRVSAAAWRRYLGEHGRPVFEYLAGLKGGDPKDMGGHLEVLMPMLEGLDQIELVQRSGPDRLALVVRFRELKK
jgi:hypothetical protein